jgi:hypothetical protein
MRHPKYQIREITVRKNVYPKETLNNVASKELMFKCDAERVVEYKNKHDAVFNDDIEKYWIVAEYNK